MVTFSATRTPTLPPLKVIYYTCRLSGELVVAITGSLVILMPKESVRRSRPGISRQVKTTTFVHPSQSQNASPSAYPASTRKVTRVLGFKARAEEAAKAKEQLREKMQCM